MLKFTSLTIEDFGPYKGSQTINFSTDDGVTFIWGNNGRGKTTLLNIFRYALYGKFKNRRGATVDLTGMSNIESRTDGKYGFRVILRMTDGTNNYELSRQYKLRDSVTKPVKNDDYEEYVYLKRDGAFLPSNEADHILKLIMPEEVSRFFLFDGELLQEYEELIMEGTETGASIKESIENILGMPVLTNGAKHAAITLEDYKRVKTKVAQSNKQTEQIGSQIAALEVELAEHTAELERLKGELKDENLRRVKLEDEMGQSEHVRSLLNTLEALEASIDEKKARQDGLRNQIIAATREAWRGLVGTKVSEVLNEVKAQEQALVEKEKASQIAFSLIGNMRTALSEKHCSLCDQDISSELLEKIEERIRASESNYGALTTDEIATLSVLRSRRAVLETMQFTSSKEKLEVLEKQLAEVKVEMSDADRKKKEVLEELDRHGDVGELSKTMQENVKALTQCLKKIENLEDGKKAENDRITSIRNALQTQNSKLDKTASGDDMKVARRRVELCEQIVNVFEEGISAYRDKLKADIERDATELFLLTRNDPDYIRLIINENYGLYIEHTSGVVVPLRSAGYEHIVAIALIGALHKNAPLQGPVIMDSPFGRLDPIHKANVTKALPALSDQVFLLAYTHEIDEQHARDSLGAALKKEYKLTRHSSFDTRVEPM